VLLRGLSLHTTSPKLLPDFVQFGSGAAAPPAPGRHREVGAGRLGPSASVGGFGSVRSLGSPEHATHASTPALIGIIVRKPVAVLSLPTRVNDTPPPAAPYKNVHLQSPMLRRVFTSCLIDLFDAYDIALRVRPIDTPQDGLTLWGVLGFGGMQLSGVVLLSVAQGILSESCPAANVPAQDWLKELTNQLAGRLRNQLLRFGADLWISCPIVLKGDRIVPALQSQPLDPCVFSTDRGLVWGWLDFEMAPNFTLTTTADSPEPMAEGESVIF
jgi:hypothetical protein